MTAPITESVALRRLTTDDLPRIAGWFEDPETSRYLGGPEWPAAMLARVEEAVGTDFRGARQIGAYHYLALTGDTPVGYVDGGVFDRCTAYGGEGPDGPIILDTIDGVTGAIAFVIDPAYRRQGLATAMILALIGLPDLAGVELFEAGVDPENHASRRALEAAGFRLRSPDPDCEAMLYYELRAAAVPSHRRVQPHRAGRAGRVGVSAPATCVNPRPRLTPPIRERRAGGGRSHPPTPEGPSQSRNSSLGAGTCPARRPDPNLDSDAPK